MLDRLLSIFMNRTADMAFETAIQSAGCPSTRGMYQMKEPEGLQEIAAAHLSSKQTK